MKDFVEELGSQEWNFATKLSDQLIRELKQHFETSFVNTASHTSVNLDDEDCAASDSEEHANGTKGVAEFGILIE